MENKWVKVYSTTEAHEITILKGILEEENIQCMEMNKHDSALTVLGETELFVQAENFLQANHLIQKFKSE